MDALWVYLASRHIRAESNNGILLIVGELRASSYQFNSVRRKKKEKKQHQKHAVTLFTQI